LNYFLPAITLIDKTLVGAKVRKVYDQPLPTAPDLTDEVKAELKRRYESYNPVLLRPEVHRAFDGLMEQNRLKVLMRQQSLGFAAQEYR
jgi:hypothetical protein